MGNSGSGKLVKHVVSTHNEAFLKQSTETYSPYLEGSPTFLTYYTLNINKTRNDGVLDTNHSLMGNATSKRYDKISDVPAWGVNQLSLDQSFDIGTIRTLTNGSILLPPGTISPKTDDFFVFNIDNKMNQHLFRINNVEFDKMISNKYYRIQFELYQNDHSQILGNIVDEYMFIFENIGSQRSTLIKKEAYVRAEDLKSSLDSMINRYIELFYKNDFDTFMFSMPNNKAIFSPYLNRLLYEEKVIDRYEEELMSEIYVQKMDQSEFGFIFNNDRWLDSIYYKILNLELSAINFKDSFIFKHLDDVSKFRKLPFYLTSDEISAMYFASDDEDISFISSIQGMSYLEKDDSVIPLLATSKVVEENELPSKIQSSQDGDIIYTKKNNAINGIYLVNIDSVYATKNAIDISAPALFSKQSEYRKNDIINLIRDYVNKEFKLDSNNIDVVKKIRVRNNLVTFLFLPMLIAILKMHIEKIYF